MSEGESFLTAAEKRFLEVLQAKDVRFMIEGATAAVLQGADIATQDIDLWFENLSDPGIPEAARAAGGFFSTRTQPPMVGGEKLSVIDVVAHMHGLETFSHEWQRSLTIEAAGLVLHVLPLERIIASKETTGRSKDLAALPALRAVLAAMKENSSES